MNVILFEINSNSTEFLFTIFLEIFLSVHRHSPPGGESGSSVDILPARALLRCGEGGNAWLKFSSCKKIQKLQNYIPILLQKARNYL